MKQAIPDSMQIYFLGMYGPTGAFREMYSRKVLEFISVIKNDNPEFNQRALAALAKKRLMAADVDTLLTDFLAAGTIWPSNGALRVCMGYQIETAETLIEYDEEETVVIELSASEISLVSKKREACEPREWFDPIYPSDLLSAIECRLEIPKSMYTGLDNMGNNLTE